MELLDKFKSILNQYEDSLYEIIKDFIDEVLVEAKNNNLNPVETFILINEKLQDFYKKMVIIQGIVSDEKRCNEKHIDYIISERVYDRIDLYLKPVLIDARKYIQKRANELLYCTSLDEMQEKYNSLMGLLSNKVIQDNSYLTEDIRLTRFM